MIYLMAHGAGASAESDWMVQAAQALERHGFEVVRFNFPYMQRAIESGSRKPPDREPVLRKAFAEQVAAHPQPLFIGGKSMGGRLATMVADELGVAGVIVFGYPFHPPGRPLKLRTAHLEKMSTPALILQGERDTFGTRAEIGSYTLSSSIEVQFLTDGDHSLTPRKKSGHTLEEHLKQAARTAAAFGQKVLRQNPSKPKE
ncbi:MAG: alpha/beta fold hydrolase [Candidatus Eremiobacteraeota bacterium]|nr:alpha/beta fold hydrolase [Candidatus Eremiobacteraeota bacterium]